MMTFAQLLGSMRFAISMLAFVGIASIIGTILKQNEPYESYIIKFGQFWFNHFEILNLYNVYQAIWFIAILLFLIASTSYCIYQNTPGFIRDIKEFNVTIQEKSLQSMKYSYQVQL
jgi:cytochrome c biogenesis protein